MCIKELRESTGMSQSEFAVYFGIPTGTLKGWEQGRRQAPSYIVEMMKRILDNEFFADKE